MYSEIMKEIKANPLGVFSYILFGNNTKIGGIASICFETAINCSSNKKGYCPMSNICYALSDYKQYKGHKARTIKTALVMRLVCKNEDIFNLFVKALQYFKVSTLRYNLVGDFESVENIDFLCRLSVSLPNLKIYGYSKRYDFKDYLNKVCTLYPNIFCGVPLDMKGESNNLNGFIPCDDIQTWKESNLTCLGDCGKCKKCYSLKGANIMCFVHGSPSKIQKRINTPKNSIYLSNYVYDKLGVKVPLKKDNTVKGFFIRTFCETLEQEGYKIPYTLTNEGGKSYNIKTVKDLINYCDFVAKFGDF